MASARPGEEYEEIVLYSIRGPENGVCPIALAVRKEEGALYGLWGDRVGDVIYFDRSIDRGNLLSISDRTSCGG